MSPNRVQLLTAPKGYKKKKEIPSRTGSFCASKISVSLSSGLQPPANAWMLIKECKFHVSGPRLTRTQGLEVQLRRQKFWRLTSTQTCKCFHGRNWRPQTGCLVPLCCKKMKIRKSVKGVTLCGWDAGSWLYRSYMIINMVTSLQREGTKWVSIPLKFGEEWTRCRWSLIKTFNKDTTENKFQVNFGDIAEKLFFSL